MTLYSIIEIQTYDVKCTNNREKIGVVEYRVEREEGFRRN